MYYVLLLRTPTMYSYMIYDWDGFFGVEGYSVPPLMSSHLVTDPHSY